MSQFPASPVRGSRFERSGRWSDSADRSVSAAPRRRRFSPLQKIVGASLLALGLTVLARRNRPAAPSAPAATLDELLHFVNDRTAGYERAVAESQDPELRGYYKQLVSQSQQFATILNTYLTREGGQRETRTTLKGKAFRKFMEAQAALTGHSETSLLAFNVHGEQWALAAYKEALADKTLTGEIRQAVERQHAASQKTLDRLKQLTEQQAKT